MADDSGLAELLVREKLITAEQLKKALSFQESLGGDLRDIIVKLGFVKAGVVSSLVAVQQNVQSIEIDEAEVDDALMAKIPAERLEQHQFVLLRSTGQDLTMAMADTNNIQAIEEVQFLTNRVVEPRLAPKGSIRSAINRFQQRQSGVSTSSDGSDNDLAVILKRTPTDTLVRAGLLTMMKKGLFSHEDLLRSIEQLS
jgi:type IV pilus assembly protein PilB